MIRSLFGFSSDSTPQRRTPCPKAVKEAVWLKYNGNKMRGQCYICSRDIDYLSFEVGHNRAYKSGGKWNVNNLRPICRICNRSMGARTTIESFKKKYFDTKSKTATKKAATRRTTTKTKTKRRTTKKKTIKRKTSKPKPKRKITTRKTTGRRKTSKRKK